MLFKHCPRIVNLITPKIDIAKCPYCGEEVEFFDYELEVKCQRCGNIVRRDPLTIDLPPCPKVLECITLLEQAGHLSHERARELKENIARIIKEVRVDEKG